MTDRYAAWRAMLAKEPFEVHDGDPQCGFYRKTKYKGGPKVGVAIFPHPDTGELVALVDGKEADLMNDLWLWPMVTADPISEKEYRKWEETGQWSDVDPSIGHNLPAGDDGLDEIRDQIENAKAGADAYAEIVDDETAARAQSLRARLNELSRAADKRRKDLKEPHLRAGKAVDEAWNPLVKDAKSAADAIARSLSAHETRKARAADAARRKAEEERRRQEEEAQKAVEAGKPSPKLATIHDPDPVQEVTVIKGGYGRAATVKVVKITRVVDQDAAYGYLKTHPELVDLIAKLAQRAVDAGHIVPGVDVSEERKVS